MKNSDLLKEILEELRMLRQEVAGLQMGQTHYHYDIVPYTPPPATNPYQPTFLIVTWT